MNDTIQLVRIIILHTPPWVWVLYAALLFVGFHRTRDSIVPVWRLFILPAAVLTMSIVTAVGGGAVALVVAGFGMVAGGMVGWLLEPDGGSRRLPDGRLAVNGEWWTLAQIVVVLVFRYATNVVAALDPGLGANSIWHWSTLFASATLSGLFLGRVVARLQAYVASPAPAGGVGT